jgi:hypothetical protein
MYKAIRVVFSALVACLVSLSAQGQSDSNIISRSSAEARRSLEFIPPQEAQKVEFDFGQTKAWLRSDGSFGIEGTAGHSGLRCGNYMLGIRFGVGSPGCTDVQWLGGPRVGAGKKQCNNGTVQLSAGGNEKQLADNYAKVTCAERLLFCDGNCGGTRW